MNWGELFFWPVKSEMQVVSLVFAVIIFAFVIWMLTDCFNRKFKVEAEKWIWIFLIIVTFWAGAILYFVFIKTLNQKGVAKNEI